MSDPDSVERCAARLRTAGLHIDVLVNNARLYTTTRLLAIDEDRLLEALEVNLVGAWRACRQFVPGMRDHGRGRGRGTCHGRGGRRHGRVARHANG